MISPPDLMRRLDRKLDIRRGLSLTYEGHLDGLAGLARRIERALDNRSGVRLSYNDLKLLVSVGAHAKLKEAAADEERAHIPAPRLPRARKADPFIYFIRYGGQGAIKIGLSSKVAERHAGLQICCPEELTIMASIQAPKEAERQLHRHFDPERIRGEWFRASPRLLAFIEQIAP